MKMGWLSAKAEMEELNFKEKKPESWDAKNFIFKESKKCIKCYLGVK